MLPLLLAAGGAGGAGLLGGAGGAAGLGGGAMLLKSKGLMGGGQPSIADQMYEGYMGDIAKMGQPSMLQQQGQDPALSWEEIIAGTKRDPWAMQQAVNTPMQDMSQFGNLNSLMATINQAQRTQAIPNRYAQMNPYVASLMGV